MSVIKDRLPPALAADFDASFAAWRKTNPGGDLAGYLASLHREKKLDTGTLSELVGLLDVELTIGGGPRAERDAEPVGLLGRGAMGEVLLARDERLNRHVALKRILSNGKDDPMMLRRFQQEAQIMAQLDHPAIVPIYGVESGPQGVTGYAMKVVRGKTLEAYLAEARAQAERRAEDEDHELPARLDVFLRVCDAVHYAHKRGVIHRDLKPANVMIGAFGEVMVMDWGIARLIGRGPELSPTTGDDAPPDASGTMVGTAIGTPPYMSPEQAAGENEALDGRSDQYALGLILQEVVSLQRAVTGKNPVQVLFRASRGDRDPMVHATGEHVARELVAIVAKATALDPAHRYKDVDALADDVRRYLRDEAILAAPDGLSQRAKRFVGKHRTATLAALLGVTLLGVLAVGGTVAGAAVAIEAYRYQAARRAESLERVHAVARHQARAIDTRFQRYEALLTGLSYAASHALRTEPPAGVRVLLANDVASQPDALPSKVYGTPLTVHVPSIWRAPTTTDADFAWSSPRMAGLDREFDRALLASKDDATVGLPKDVSALLVANDGVPMVWAYVALEDGTITTVPGAGDYPADYDVRSQDWYQHGRGLHTVRWEPANADESDNAEALGLSVSAIVGLWDGDEQLGVAGADVSVRYVVKELLTPPDMGAPVDTWLVDDRGVTLATSTSIATQPPPYPRLAVLPRGVDSGVVEVEDAAGARLVAFARLEALGWTYAIEGPADQLLR